MADMLNLKKWGWVTNRSGWLLELLTELTICCSNIKILPIYSPLEFSSVIFEGKKKKEMISIEDCKFEKKVVGRV